jgi:DNA-binding response OmpR family regulator
MRILVVEDSARLQRTLGTALRRSGYAVDVAGDGDEGLWLAESNAYDAIVLDIMLPKRDGLSVLRALRASGRPAHVLLLTARDAVSDRVAGLHAGADDYLVKPFALEELLARVAALCRRAYGTKQPRLVVGDLEIDPAARTVRRAGRGVELTAREYQLLEYLARRRGEVVSRGDIEEHIYDGQVDPMSNVVDSAVCLLRKKLAVTPAAAPLIHTRRGHGYVLDAAPAP